MKEFSKKLTPENKSKFNNFRTERNLCYLRREITENILMENEENYFDFTQFKHKFSISDAELPELIKIIVKELNKLGWKTSLSYGDSALFIYASKKPQNCYDDEL